MALNVEWISAQIESELRLWLASPDQEEFCLRQSEREIEGFLRKEPVRPSISVSLQLVARWYLVTGAIEVLDGNARGTANLSRGFTYYFWKSLALWAFFAKEKPKKRFRRITFNEDGLILSSALALGYLDCAELLAKVDLWGLKNNAFVGLEATSLTPFMLSLVCQWKSLPMPSDVLPMRVSGVFEEVLNNWQSDDLSRVEAVLLEACDFHTHRSHEHTDREYYEFSDEVFMIYPAEILAVMRLRKVLGLALPNLDHPLMNSPLAQLHDPVSAPADPLLERLKPKLVKDLPVLRQILTDPSKINS